MLICAYLKQSEFKKPKKEKTIMKQTAFTKWNNVMCCCRMLDSRALTWLGRSIVRLRPRK